MNAKVKAVPKTKAKAKAEPVTLLPPATADSPITYAQLDQAVNALAGGNRHNVIVQPNANVELTADKPTPFGFGGSATGVRATIQNWILFGVPIVKGKPCDKTAPRTHKGEFDRSVATILAMAKKLGHSTAKPNCLLAMLNGGYERNSKTWGVSFITLQVAPQLK
jgi:hypothetical protein|tara:strand:+ start:218 stop:712 length:495 start_codon:yes stop_codon:yes gene_type:complete